MVSVSANNLQLIVDRNHPLINTDDIAQLSAIFKIINIPHIVSYNKDQVHQLYS